MLRICCIFKRGERVVIINYIIGGLFTLTYFIRIIMEDRITPTYGIIGGIISTIYLICILDFCMNKLSFLSWIEKYTIIVTFFLAHIIIFGTIFFMFFSFMMIIYEVYGFRNDKDFRELKYALSTIFNKSFKEESKVKTVIKQINNLINPFSKLADNIKISLGKIIKTIMLISYIASGVIILSVVTNYLEIKGFDFSIASLKRDYELYKTVFVTSIIPFTINYVRDLNKQ